MLEREIKFNCKVIKIHYRDDSDQSVIDEFFVDKMYRSVESIISNIPASSAGRQYPILDIGAHIGVFSLYSYVLCPPSYVLALEPEPNNFKLLKDNLKLNGCKNVKVLQAALVTGKESTTKLYLSKNTHNHSTLSLRGAGGDAAIQSPSITVPAINLEQLMKKHKIKKIGLLKSDIEGAEFEIIQNMKHGTWSKIQNVVVEYHESGQNKRSELETLIRSHGFSVEHFPNKFDKRFGLLVCRNKKM